MKRSIAIALLSLSSMTAFAQTPDVPPTQAPAGNPGKFVKPTTKAPAAATTDAATPAAKPMTKAEKAAARKAKRAAKVGDKPIN
jgi:hypothetical protein